MTGQIRERIILTIPFIASMISWVSYRYLFSIVAIISAFICIAICKTKCGGSKNLYLFIYAAVISVPVNIKISDMLSIGLSDYLIDNPFMKILYFPISYAFVFSFEEILLGLIAEIIWRNEENA